MSSTPLSESLPVIDAPYFLSVSVPLDLDDQGVRWTNDLWAKDLALHLDYISDLTLASPTRRRNPEGEAFSLAQPPFDRLKFVDLPLPRNRLEAIRTLPRLLSQVWRAVGQAQIAHTGFGVWPIREGWVVVPIARLRRKFVLTNVESSFWRTTDPHAPWYRRLLGFLAEHATRACVKVADLRLFTSSAYLMEFLPPDAPRAFVTPATWIDDEWILGDDAALASWSSKTGPTRLLFAGRLVPEKGLPTLVEAIRAADQARAELDVAILGEGPLREQCQDLARSLVGQVKLRVVDPIAYGVPFLSFLREFDAVLVPSLSDEQPRILFDALCQAVPVIGSSTGGILEIVAPDVTGRLLPPGDASALSEALVWAGRNRDELKAMGLRGPAKVRRFTHRAMHQNRHAILNRALADLRSSSG